MALAASLPAAVEAGKPSRQLKDAVGKEVSLPDDPRRIMSLCTTATDTILRLGEGGRLAGIDEYSRIVPGASNLAVLGRGSAISREQVLARRIDLAFIWWYQDEPGRLLEELGVPVVRLRCQRAAEVPPIIRLIGQCLGRTNTAEQLAQSVCEKLAQLTPANTQGAPRVYLELYSAFKTSGRDSYVNDLIEWAGGRNIAAVASGPVLLSAEQLVASDPQMVVLVEGFGTPEQFARRSGMAGLTAVRTGRVYVLDRYWLVAGAGLPEGVAALRNLWQGNKTIRP